MSFIPNTAMPRKNLLSQRAFTLVEVLVATVLLGLLAAGAIWALAQANNYASVSRLYTGAETAAQNQIDVILTDGPFNPQYSPAEVPSALNTGGSTQTVTIYSEPAGADGRTHAVTGQMTTTVAAVTPAVLIKGQDLNLFSATVVVTYTFRGRPYRVQLNAVRASDA